MQVKRPVWSCPATCSCIYRSSTVWKQERCFEFLPFFGGFVAPISHNYTSGEVLWEREREREVSQQSREMTRHEKVFPPLPPVGGGGACCLVVWREWKSGGRQSEVSSKRTNGTYGREEKRVTIGRERGRERDWIKKFGVTEGEEEVDGREQTSQITLRSSVVLLEGRASLSWPEAEGGFGGNNTKQEEEEEEEEEEEDEEKEEEGK